MRDAREGTFLKKSPLPSRSLPKRRGRIPGDSGGRGCFSERSTSPPRPPLSRRATGVRRGTFLLTWFRLRGGCDSLPLGCGHGGSVSRRDHNQAAGNRTRLAGAYSQEKGAAQTPATLRERGSGGEALLLEKRPLPQNLPTVASSGGGPGEGLLAEKPPPPEHHPRT